MALDITTIPELAGVKARSVEVRGIIIQDDMQPRLRISEDAVRRYKDTLRQNPQALPPVLLRKTDGGHVVIDGWHRFQAHRELRLKYIKAMVIQCSEERALWLAALANMSHGLPLKRGDQRRVFRRYIKAGANREADGTAKSYREIHADLNGLRAVGTLHKWMQQEFPALAAEMAGRGEEIEETTYQEPRTSEAEKLLKEYTLGFIRVAKMALNEDKEDIRDDILNWVLYLTVTLRQATSIIPQGLYTAAMDAYEERQRAEEEMLRDPL